MCRSQLQRAIENNPVLRSQLAGSGWVPFVAAWDQGGTAHMSMILPLFAVLVISVLPLFAVLVISVLPPFAVLELVELV